ncbi:FMN-binding protein [Raineyella sp. LH-20]|uniref:FMN-binding protein n=1 Tax=Raineyella sp. LH-20 TaxID=3081204 RepID=UPI0029550FBD|nr:FMN-binding protein [Raineyella sp. LH-20]WOP18640.1 FMN-binding protein [Raineyella sp. LH-20]
MKIVKPAAIAGATAAAVAGVLALNPTSHSLTAQAGPADSAGESSPTTASGTGGSSASTSSSPSASSSSRSTSRSSSSASPSAGSGTTATGSAVSTPYGSMQVKATVSNGTITAIQWVQLPGDGHSQRINSYAAPALVQQALQAQSAQVDGVSGATYTSGAFQQSLQSALTKAGFKG